ncbi:Outer membrane efflux protein [marine gamma proteobacterium HTCC2143]|uniref:Outer membrane efflux protein n=1 Tax=marine gamma proteobacterium HTCC2143 TaxID=247633 RepID=A0YBR2_9GAMM|nr:Outer membrane efflux protein [marine gamma proteobacterium HTCC2143]
MLNKHDKILLLTTVLTLMQLALPVQAQNSVLSAAEAVKTAVSENPGLAEMQARFRAMSEIPSQMGTLPDPVVSFGAMNFPTDSFDRDQEPMTQLQVGISQAFPFPGKLNLREEAAEFDAQAAFYTADEMRLMLIANVQQKWWQIFYLDRAIDTIRSNQVLLKQFIDVAKTKYETGKGLQQDVLLAQLEQSKLIDKNIQIQALRSNQAILLNTMMNLRANAEVSLPRTVNKSLPTILNEHRLYQLAAIHRPIIKQREQTVAASESRLDLAKRNEYPDFNVAVNYGNRSGNNPMPMSGSRSDFVSVMVGIKVPLYSGRKQSKAIRQKSSELEKNHYAVLDEKGRVSAEISTAVIDYRRAGEQMSLFGSGIVPQARQTVQSMLAGYQVSKVDFLNLVRSQITLLNYELQYWKSLSEAKQALAKIQAAVGEESIYE